MDKCKMGHTKPSSSEDIMEHTQGKWFPMQEDLFHGHKGRIILTTQELIDKNLPMIAKDLTEANARFICKAVNSHNGLVSACKEGHKRLAFLQKIIIETNLIVMDGIEIRKTASCLDFIGDAIAAIAEAEKTE